MARLETSPDGGKTWQAVKALRTSPGGLDQGQTDKSQSGKVAISNGGATTVVIGTVTTGKTLFFSDLSFDLSASTCDVSIQVGGVAIWQRFLQTGLGVNEHLQRPLSAPAGAAVTLVFGTSGAGTPNAYFNLGCWEQ